MKKIAIILSGCGHLDGAEIREVILTLLAVDRLGGEYHLFAPDINQSDVINHLNNQTMNEKRNILVESARIARGDIKALSKLIASDFDALILPGGYGAAKNFSDIAIKGKEASYILPDLQNIILEFLNSKKTIGAICIAPAVLALALKGKVRSTLTIGEDNDLIKYLEADHKVAKTEEIVFDEKNNIISCSAYMRNDSISKVAEGIEKLVKKIMQL